jgi:hypothetical protein
LLDLSGDLSWAESRRYFYWGDQSVKALQRAFAPPVARAEGSLWRT